MADNSLADHAEDDFISMFPTKNEYKKENRHISSIVGINEIVPGIDVRIIVTA